jgi:hypothetical protein
MISRLKAPAAAGFDHHLTKPADPDQLEKHAAAFFNGRDKEDSCLRN